MWIRTLGSFVSPLGDHSLTSAGASIDVALASSIKGSLMMLMTKPPVLFLTLSVVSLSLSGAALRQEKATTGGQLLIWTISIEWVEAERGEVVRLRMSLDHWIIRIVERLRLVTHHPEPAVAFIERATIVKIRISEWDVPERERAKRGRYRT